MSKKPFLIATIVTALSAIGYSTQASADVGAGVVIGGTVGALVGGPPGAVAGALIGAAIGEEQHYKDARIYGDRNRYAYGPPPAPQYAPPQYDPRYAPRASVALPPPGFYGTPPDYAQPRGYVGYAPPVAYYPPAPRPYYAPQPRVVYASPPYYYGPRRPYYNEAPAF